MSEIAGPPALSRVRCHGSCGGETLHKHLACIHCGTEHTLPPDWIERRRYRYGKHRSLSIQIPPPKPR